MVYGGKPSRGCRTCRARRIKCDEGKPTCRRCEKSQRECGGYRPEFEIVHRDQTGSTIRRNVLRNAAGVKQEELADQTMSTHPIVFVQEQPQPPRRQPSDSESTPSTPSPVMTLTVPIAQRASCFFAANFILVPLKTSSAAPHGFMDYLVHLIESQSPGDAPSALHHAFNACAFGLLGNRARADGVDLARLSLKEHTLALAQTHKALGHPATATTDATLAAVLLLCLYESITAIKESRMLAWRSHIDGAVNIIKARGREKMCQTGLGTLLFIAVRYHLVSRTLSSGTPLPFGADWWMSGGDTKSLLATSQRFALKYSEFRAELSGLLASSRSPQSIQQMHELARRIQNTDQDIANWLVSIPDEFRFKTLYWVKEDGIELPKDGNYDGIEVFPGRVDVYPDFVTASAWNIGRVSRLLLASLAIRITARICAPVDYRTTPEYETSRRMCKGTIADIIASVPYHFGWHLKRKTSSRSEPGLSGFACGEEGPGKALPALFLMWSLTCVKNNDISSEKQREWAKGRLKFIADHVGLKYAHIVNEVNIRFPSMMIRMDGSMTSPDPLLNRGGYEPSFRPMGAPDTPESLVSAKPSPSPG